MSTEFNWSWISSLSDTKNKSDYVLRDSGIVYSFRQAYSGPTSSKDLNAFISSVGQNFQSVRSNWRLYSKPILDSLPAGGNDSRWSYELNKGLPDKIDCFKYGVQGSTLFVFNDASSSKADGRYWVANEYRPKTIAEALEDLYVLVTDSSSSTSTSSSDVDLDPLWASIGESYRNDYLTADSLDERTSVLEGYINQLNNDIYGPENFSTSLGEPLTYSIASILNELLTIHNVSGWGSDPSDVSHSGVTVASHTHAYTNITPAPGQSITQGRTGPYTSLDNDIKRLRYEIQQTRGSTNWYSDVTDPVTGTSGNLGTHLGYQGTGILSSSNPHKIGIVETGAATVFNAVRSYTGMESNTDTDTSYSSTNYISNGDPLVTAIGKLDDQIQSISTSVTTRVEYQFDRSSLSETERDQTPVVVTHNMGKKPILQTIDISPEEEDYYGQYVSPETYINIVHNSDNEFEIWTNAAKIEVIAIY